MRRAASSSSTSSTSSPPTSHPSVIRRALPPPPSSLLLPLLLLLLPPSARAFSSSSSHPHPAIVRLRTTTIAGGGRGAPPSTPSSASASARRILGAILPASRGDVPPRRPRHLASAPSDGGIRVDDRPHDDGESPTPSSSSPSPRRGGGGVGDAVRSANGIRPSLHPTTINCVSEALLLRSRSVLARLRDGDGRQPSSSNGDDDMVPIDAGDPSNEPLRVAIAAGDIALNAINRRRDAAKADDGDDGSSSSSAFTAEESQTISGRVVGVVMRMRNLEKELVTRVGESDWVGRYGEEGGFGVLPGECHRSSGRPKEEGGAPADEKGGPLLAERMCADPLFRMNRAECLLALFLSTVERPRMEALSTVVPGGSGVDFVDGDRLGVILPPEK